MADPLYNFGDIVSMSRSQVDTVTVTAPPGGGAFTYEVTIAGRLFQATVAAGQTVEQAATAIAEVLLVQQTVIRTVLLEGALLRLVGALASPFEIEVGARLVQQTVITSQLGRIPDPIRILKSRVIYTRDAEGRTLEVTWLRGRRQTSGVVDPLMLQSADGVIEFHSSDVLTLIARREERP